jgi:DNA repair protein RadC
MAQSMAEPAARCRYEVVLNAARETTEFSLAALKLRVREERPALVTRMVNALAHEGHLQKLGPASDPVYRWTDDPARFAPARWLAQRQSGTQMKNAPAGDRPRERLLVRGPGALRTAELLAILIRSGRQGESALQAGEKLANRYAESIEQLPDAGLAELKAISPVVAKTAYCQIMAGIELGRRIAERAVAVKRPAKITCSADAIAICAAEFQRLATDGMQEEFHIVCLDTKNRVLATHAISVGILDASLVHPREVFRPAIRDAAAAILLVHNHPSGDPTPSSQDLAVTRKLESAGDQLGIKVLDHIIVSASGAVSLQELR